MYVKYHHNPTTANCKQPKSNQSNGPDNTETTKILPQQPKHLHPKLPKHLHTIP